MKKAEKIQMQEQEPKSVCFYSVCFYSLKGISYPEENWVFNLYAKTYEGIVNKIKSVYETKYPNDKYYEVSRELKGNYPKDQPTIFKFSAAYTFGPEVTYEIYIKEIYSEELTD